MNDNLKSALAHLTVAGVLIGAGAVAYFQTKKEAELQMLNNELFTYGYLAFEPAIANARSMVAYERARRELASEFADIINFNYSW